MRCVFVDVWGVICVVLYVGCVICYMYIVVSCMCMLSNVLHLRLTVPAQHMQRRMSALSPQYIQHSTCVAYSKIIRRGVGNTITLCVYVGACVRVRHGWGWGNAE